MAGAGVIKGVRYLQSICDSMTKSKHFDRNYNRVKILAGGNGSLTAIMKIEEEDTNRGGFLHGGMSCLLVDGLSTAALMTHPKVQTGGVSVNINMAYMKAVPIGQEIVIKANTDKVGGRLAFLTVEILNRATGEIVVKGTHTKFIG